MTISINFTPAEPIFDLRSLKPRTRNQVRALLFTPFKKSVSLINKIRSDKSAKEILQIERILRTFKACSINLPELFPEEIQTRENYYRLCALAPEKQIAQINYLVSDCRVVLNKFVSAIFELDKLILDMKLVEADVVIREVVREFGCSNLILRKALLVKSLSDGKIDLLGIDDLLDKAGVSVNNFIVSSTFRCYQKEQSILSLKRSVMSLVDKGLSNKFTRDMLRVTFHPHAMNLKDLSEMAQSNLQSSLIDAILILKVNRGVLDPGVEWCKNLESFFDQWDQGGIDVDKIASLYLGEEDGESIFYKHSSAWLEHKDIVAYRLLQDHFYDDPDSNYFAINDGLVSDVSEWVKELKLEDVAAGFQLTTHSYPCLKMLEHEGAITRSSVFNYVIHRCGGHAVISEEALYCIMGQTRDLARTTNVVLLKTLSKYAEAPWVQLIYCLLVAKRSASEVDDHKLRKLVEKLVHAEHGGDLLSFFEAATIKSKAVAVFAYEVFTADFISKLTRIIKSSAQITETRADLHKWMGGVSGEKSFLDRARTLLIDHQINLVRNELDDHRIYVDAVRFDEWINDELARELNMLFTSVVHNKNFANGEDALLMQIIERAYYSFCSNNKFGIASYLGRRIRHGTFKGHLYSSVVGIESSQKYSRLFNDAQFLTRWQQWKVSYEAKIDDTIRNRLHIESNSKRDGLMKPTTKSAGKQEIAIACAKSLVKHFAEHKSVVGMPLILTEYCWRVAEVDLRSVSSYLKGQKPAFFRHDLLPELSLSHPNRDLAREFIRELTHLVNEKFKTMHGWFKKPVSVAPKASLSLLYRAVVAEVKLYFPDFEVDTEYEENEDIEIMGGAYHVLYDALYVVVYNAAKHGSKGGVIDRKFTIFRSPENHSGSIVVELSSEIDESENEDVVNEKLKVLPEDDIDNAQLSEERSGIRKLHQLQRVDPRFNLKKLLCEGRKVCAVMSYDLEHV